MNGLVSIIIPVYNTEKYLRRCLDSVIGQTYYNIEVIIVDDGSNDDSLNICKQYAFLDHRIDFIHQSNAGVSTARNVGLKNAKGDYICLIDADDYLDDRYVETMLKAMANVDMVACSSYILEGDDGKCQSINTIAKDSMLSKKEALYCLFNSNGYHGWCWNKMFKLDVIKKNTLHFEEKLKFCEDELFCLQYILHIDSACFIKDRLYHYVRNEKSVNHIIYLEGFNYRALDRLDADEMCWQLIRPLQDAHLNRIYKSRRFISNYITLDKFLCHYNNDKITLDIIKHNLRRYIWYYLIDNSVKFKRKFSMFFISFFPLLYYKLKNKCQK